MCATAGVARHARGALSVKLFIGGEKGVPVSDCSFVHHANPAQHGTFGAQDGAIGELVTGKAHYYEYGTRA